MKHPSIDETIQWAARLHEGQRDKAGVPYIAHPLAVMRRVRPELWHVAVLHDVMEDCSVTDADLHHRGYTDHEIGVIRALTRRGETYNMFIDRVIADGQDAIEVKCADIDDNLDPSRPSVHAKENRDLMRRYRFARARLEMARE